MSRATSLWGRKYYKSVDVDQALAGAGGDLPIFGAFMPMATGLGCFIF
jgi:hypothetical protein